MRMTGAVRAAVMVIAAGAAGLPSAAMAFDLLPHRAVYEIGLERSEGASGITNVDGRLVFEILGSACEGYSVNMRFVSQIDGEETATTSDLQSATFEDGDGSLFRFVSRSLFNDMLAEEIDGVATRTDDGIEVVLTKPEEHEFPLNSEILFPTEHIVRIIEAAERGKSFFAAQVFNGTDGGEKVLDATAVIGNKEAANPDLSGPGANVLRDLERWPVTIAYFDPSEDDGETPSYEFSYDLYSNGVSSRVTLDYGRFAISGALSSVEFLDATPCEQ